MSAEAHAKALVSKRGVEWGKLDLAGRAAMASAAMSELGHLGAEAHAKALTRGVEWDSLDKAGRAEMESAAMSEVGQLGPEAHAKALAITRGVEWELLDPSGRKEMTSAAMSEMTLRVRLRKRTEATETCARKIAHSEGKDWDSLWTLTQESYRDEAETVCQNCYVGGSASKTQKDAFHNLLTGAVRHWMGKDYWGDLTVDRPPDRYPPDLDIFKHNEQPLLARVMTKCNMITTKLRLSKIVTPFPVFEEHWDPNAVITMADDQDGTLDVKLLELLCYTCTRYKNKGATALKMKNDGLPKSMNRGCQSI